MIVFNKNPDLLLQLHGYIRLALIFLLSWTSVIAVPEIDVGDGSALPGNDAELPIHYISDNTSTAIQFDLEFNPSLSTPLNAAARSALDDHVVITNLIGAGRYRVLIYSPSNTLVNDGVLVDVPFTLNENFSDETEIIITNIRVVDADGQVITPSAVSNGTLSTIAGFLLELFPGWNSFSLPLDPTPADVDQIFKLETPVKVWELKYEEGGDGGPKLSQVATLKSKQGYWVYLPKKMDVSVGGSELTDNAVSLSVGWNIIGVAEETDYTSNPKIDGNIWIWDNERQRFQVVKPTDKLVPGVGYWIHTEDRDLTLFGE